MLKNYCVANTKALVNENYDDFLVNFLNEFIDPNQFSITCDDFLELLANYQKFYQSILR